MEHGYDPGNMITFFVQEPVEFPWVNPDFSYLYNEKEHCWRLSPAYDLTFSNTYYGEHTTTVNGNGKNPGKKDLICVGVTAGLSRGFCEQTVDEIERCVLKMLGGYLR